MRLPEAPEADHPTTSADRRRRRSRMILGAVFGLAAVTTCVVLYLVVAEVVRAFDTDRDLQDFASPAEARAFTSAHLPSALPADASVESLRYDRFTDWHLDARVGLGSAEAVDRYLERVKADRKLNDAYCGDGEPAGGARYFLADVHACGTIQRTSTQVLEVRCYTR